LRATYDPEGDVLSLLLREGQIVRAEDHGLIIVNYGGDGGVVEIEVMRASEFLGSHAPSADPHIHPFRRAEGEMRKPRN
jgi:uncharacterized protein YuzE